MVKTCQRVSLSTCQRNDAVHPTACQPQLALDQTGTSTPRPGGTRYVVSRPGGARTQVRRARATRCRARLRRACGRAGGTARGDAARCEDASPRPGGTRHVVAAHPTALERFNATTKVVTTYRASLPRFTALRFEAPQRTTSGRYTILSHTPSPIRALAVLVLKFCAVVATSANGCVPKVPLTLWACTVTV